MSADQDREVQLPQCCHSIANITIYISTLYIYIFFAPVLTVFEILPIKICDLDNIGQGYGIQLSQFDDNHENL